MICNIAYDDFKVVNSASIARCNGRKTIACFFTYQTGGFCHP